MTILYLNYSYFILKNMTSMNESYFQDYSLTERPEEIIKFVWNLPEIGPGNIDVLLFLSKL